MIRKSLLLGTVLGLAACGGEIPPPDVVARMGGAEIELAAFERYLEESSIDLDAGLGDRVLSRLFDEFLDETLLLQAAVDEGLVDAGGTRREALEALLDVQLEAELTDERVLLYYRAHSDRFDRPERVRLSQILVEDRATAEQALQELASGVPFEEVARRLSTEPAAERGGDQGFLGRDDLPPAFADTIFELEVGESSEIVAADYGFHVFQVTERRSAELVPVREAADEIRGLLRRTESQEARERLVEEARGRYNTSVYASNLPFDYQGIRTQQARD